MTDWYDHEARGVALRFLRAYRDLIREEAKEASREEIGRLHEQIQGHDFTVRLLKDRLAEAESAATTHSASTEEK